MTAFTVLNNKIMAIVALLVLSMTASVHVQAEEPNNQPAKLPPRMIDFEHLSAKDGLGNQVVYDFV